MFLRLETTTWYSIILYLSVKCKQVDGYLKLTWKVIYHWKWQSYSSSEPFLKQGISSEYTTVDVICMGLLGLQGAKTENYKILNLNCRLYIGFDGLMD